MLTFLHSSSLCLYSLPFLVLACGVGGLPLRRYSLHVRAVWVLVYVSISYSPVRKRERSDSCEPLQFSFLHALIFLHGLRGDSGRGLRAVAYLRVGGRCAYRPPSLTTRHSQRYRATRQQRQHDRLDDFVNLLLCHRLHLLP